MDEHEKEIASLMRKLETTKRDFWMQRGGPPPCLAFSGVSKFGGFDQLM